MKGGLLNKQTQTQKILQYLENFGSISSYEAVVELGITQLAARLRNLEDDGYVFNRETIKGKNRLGEDARYIKYSLKEV